MAKTVSYDNATFNVRDIINAEATNIFKALDSVYPIVIAKYITINSLLQVANKYGDVDDANYYAEELIKLQDSWFDIVGENYPIENAEEKFPKAFNRALDLLQEES